MAQLASQQESLRSGRRRVAAAEARVTEVCVQLASCQHGLLPGSRGTSYLGRGSGERGRGSGKRGRGPGRCGRGTCRPQLVRPGLCCAL